MFRKSVSVSKQGTYVVQGTDSSTRTFIHTDTFHIRVFAHSYTLTHFHERCALHTLRVEATTTVNDFSHTFHTLFTHFLTRCGGVK